jgi:hypothetical protein
VLDDRDDDDQLRRQKQDRRDQEDVRGVVGLVPRRLDERDLGQCGAGREQQERQPDLGAVGLRLESGNERRRDERSKQRDPDEVGGGGNGKPPVDARAPLRALAE